jgi:hypothetical protein
MASKIFEQEAELTAALLGDERVRRIDWDHPSLRELSRAARLIYASLVDNCSDEARQTLAGVEAVWRNRDVYRRATSTTRARKAVLEAICAAVEELLDEGLLLLVDEQAISRGWVRRPWEEVLS